jgi:multimeric flavodoxin WrbA
MKILGISGSGRPDGITNEVVREILQATESEYEYITLAGKSINGCRACLQCVEDSICKQQDDWTIIGQKMLEADSIVFGAPTYYGVINALGQACLERTFCFRHQERFLLAGKLGVAVGVAGGDRKTNHSGVIDYIELVMRSNMMAIAGKVYAEGYDQCFSCGYGENCAAGGVVEKHGFIDRILPEHCPPRLNKQKEALLQAQKAGKILGSISKDRAGR